jgi:hypothetical protein
MTRALSQAAPGSVFGLLDVRHSKLHVLKAPNPGLHALLEGEAAAFSTMYSALEGPAKPAAVDAEPPEAPSNVVSIQVPFRPTEPRSQQAGA